MTADQAAGLLILVSIVSLGYAVLAAIDGAWQLARRRRRP